MTYFINFVILAGLFSGSAPLVTTDKCGGEGRIHFNYDLLPIMIIAGSKGMDSYTVHRLLKDGYVKTLEYHDAADRFFYDAINVDPRFNISAYLAGF